MLNPVSNDDIKKIQYRQQRPRPVVGGMKSSSILMKKLDSGFNVVGFLERKIDNMFTTCFSTYVCAHSYFVFQLILQNFFLRRGGLKKILMDNQ
jgi:hypothetical protein